jgi:tetratricopeptide (TPR) repeat protein
MARASHTASARRKTAKDYSDLRVKRFWNVPLCSVCIVSFCLYLPSLAAGFIHDDHVQIVQNPQIQSWGYFFRLLTTDVWSQKETDHVGYYYRPLFSLWMLLVHTMGGLNPWFWHLSNIFLHVVATYLVYCLCSLFLKSAVASFFAALLFAAHPVHVDAVSWVSASNELLCSIFVLAALVTLANGAIEREKSWIALSLTLYLGALLSKETAVAALPFFPIMWWLVGNDTGEKRNLLQKKKALRMGGLYVIPLILYLIMRALVLGRTGVEAGKHTWAAMVFTSPSLLIFYLKKLVWPSGLAGFYVNPLISSPDSHIWLLALLLLLATGLLVLVSYRVSVIFALAGTLIFLPLLPLLAGIRLYDEGNMTHDRYLYLPSVGLCLLLGLAIDKAPDRLRARLVIVSTLAAIVILLGYSTVRQQRFYRNDELFYRRALMVDPTNALVMRYLGNAYLEASENEQAIEWFQRAVKTAPDDSNAEFYLARGLMKTQQYSAAEPYLKDLAYGTRPVSRRRKAAVLLSLANAQMQLNEPGRAEQTLMDLANFDFNFPGLHRTLGIVFQRAGRIEEAQKQYALEFQISSDGESGQQAFTLARRLADADAASHR